MTRPVSTVDPDTPAAPTARRRSRLTWLGVSALVFAVASLPYLYGFLSAPADRVYTGLMFDVPDHAQYWSWVTASRAGLFITNTMTPEANPAIFMNPVMWLLARVQTGFGLSFPALFQVWRLTATVLLVVALLAFCRALVPDRARRVTALWLALAGAGLGWVLVVVKVVRRLPDVPFPMDLYIVEPNTFFGLLAYPHLVLAQGLLLLALLGVWLASRRRGWPAHLLGGAGALGLALSHPYDLLTVYLVIAAFGAVSLVRTRAVPWPLVVNGAIVAACSAPVALYYQTLTAHDPLWRAVLAQYANAGVWTPPHVHLVVLMGLPLLLAVAGLFPRHPRDDRFWFVTAWAATGLVSIYLPVVYQVKFLGGWQFPIAILAAGAWHDRVTPGIGRWLERLAVRRLSVPAASLAVLVLLVVPTNLYLYAWRFVDLRRHASPYYLHQDEVAALDWLAAHATASDVVLAPEAIGRWVPNYGAARAFLAHWAMTNRYHERVEQVEQFFGASATDDWRRAFLRDAGVTLVVGYRGEPGGDNRTDLRASPLLDPVLLRPRVEVYRVNAAGPGGPADEGGR